MSNKKKYNKSELIACEFFTWRLRRRSNGVYYADGRFGDQPRGKHTLETRDRDEAVETLKLLDRKIAVKRGLVSDFKPVEGVISIDDGWEAYFEHCRRPASLGGTTSTTLARYRSIRKRFTQFCSDKRLQGWNEVDRQVIDAYVTSLKGKIHADRTFRVELQVVLAVHNWLINSKKLAADHKISISLPRPEGSDRYCYRREEVAAMVAHCAADPSRHWLRALIVGLACTGMRVRELLGLRWSDLVLDDDAKTIKLADERAHGRKQQMGSARRVKGKRSRYLPIHRDLLEVLEGLERHPDNKILRGPAGEPLQYQVALKAFIAQVVEPLKEMFHTPPGEIGFEHGRFHSFRHFFCSEASRCGATDAELKNWLGNRTSELVDHYRHIRAEDSRRRMQGIDFLGTVGGNA